MVPSLIVPDRFPLGALGVLVVFLQSKLKHLIVAHHVK